MWHQKEHKTCRPLQLYNSQFWRVKKDNQTMKRRICKHSNFLVYGRRSLKTSKRAYETKLFSRNVWLEKIKCLFKNLDIFNIFNIQRKSLRLEDQKSYIFDRVKFSVFSVVFGDSFLDSALLFWISIKIMWLFGL